MTVAALNYDENLNHYETDAWSHLSSSSTFAFAGEEQYHSSPLNKNSSKSEGDVLLTNPIVLRKNARKFHWIMASNLEPFKNTTVNSYRQTGVVIGNREDDLHPSSDEVAELVSSSIGRSFDDYVQRTNLEHFQNEILKIKTLELIWSDLGYDFPNNIAFEAYQAFVNKIRSPILLNHIKVTLAKDGGISLFYKNDKMYFNSEFYDDGTYSFILRLGDNKHYLGDDILSASDIPDILRTNIFN